MRGIVVYFDREKGYGFIRNGDYPQDIFVHIRHIRNQEYLSQGQAVRFEVEKNEKGLTAVQVVPRRKQVSPYAIYGSASVFAFLGGFIFLSWIEWNGWLAALISINAITLLYYGYDKIISRTHLLRVPERIFHILALIGGSPAALVSQRIFHHKTLKRSFQIAYWSVVIIQIIVILIYVLYFSEPE